MKLPRRLKYRGKKYSERTQSAVPYTYLTVKDKCFETLMQGLAVVRTCASDAHSCMRKIISFKVVPGRRFCKPIHRAIQTLIQFFPTIELWGVSKQYSTMKGAVDGLDDNHLFLTECKRCGGEKDCVLCGTVDAPAYYETVPPGLSVNALIFYIVRAWRTSPFRHVGVRRSKKLEAKLCTPRQDPLINDYFPESAGTWTFSFIEMLLYYAAYINWRFTQAFGAVWVCPSTATMIGNPFGRIAVALVSGRAALEFDEAWNTYVQGTPLEGTTREEVLGMVMYVDDVFFCSYVLCMKCFLLMLQDIFPNTFDITTQGRTTRFLDAKVYLDRFRNMRLTPVLKNQLFLEGHVGKPDHQSIPPWWSGFSVATISGIFQGSITRWFQLTPKERLVTHLAWLRTVEFLMLGYSVRLLRKAWRRVSFFDIRRLAIRALAIVKRRNLGFDNITAVAFAAQELKRKGIATTKDSNNTDDSEHVPSPSHPEHLPHLSSPSDHHHPTMGWSRRGGKGGWTEGGSSSSGHGGKGAGKGWTINVHTSPADKKDKKHKKRRRSRSSSGSSSSSRSSSSSGSSSSGDSKKDKKEKKKERKAEKKRLKKMPRKERKAEKTRLRAERKKQKKFQEGLEKILKDTSTSLGGVMRDAMKEQTKAITAVTAKAPPPALDPAIAALSATVITLCAGEEDLTGKLNGVTSVADITTAVNDELSKSQLIRIMETANQKLYTYQDKRQEKKYFVKELMSFAEAQP